MATFTRRIAEPKVDDSLPEQRVQPAVRRGRRGEKGFGHSALRLADVDARRRHRGLLPVLSRNRRPGAARLTVVINNCICDDTIR